MGQDPQAAAKPRPSAESDATEREAVEREVAGESEAVDAAAAGALRKTDAEGERAALSYILGARKALPYEVKTTFETEDGPKPVTFVFHQVDGRRLDEIETQHRDRTTGVMRQVEADVAVAAEAMLFVEDESGERIEVTSDAFRTVNPQQPPLASPGDALTARFANQLGILSGVAREVRRVSGWAPERVGQAERRLVEASGNS